MHLLRLLWLKTMQAFNHDTDLLSVTLPNLDKQMVLVVNGNVHTPMLNHVRFRRDLDLPDNVLVTTKSRLKFRKLLVVLELCEVYGNWVWYSYQHPKTGMKKTVPFCQSQFRCYFPVTPHFLYIYA